MLSNFRQKSKIINGIILSIFVFTQPMLPEASAQSFKKSAISNKQSGSSATKSSGKIINKSFGSSPGSKGVNPGLFTDSFEQGDVQQWVSEYESYQPKTSTFGRTGSPTKSASQEYPSSFPTDNHVDNFNSMLKALESGLANILNKSALFNSFDSKQLSESMIAIFVVMESMFDEVDRMYQEVDAKNDKADSLVDQINAAESVGPKEAAVFNAATDSLAKETQQMANQIDPMLKDVDRMIADVNRMTNDLEKAESNKIAFDKEMRGIEEYFQNTQQTFSDLKLKLKKDNIKVKSGLANVEKFFREIQRVLTELKSYKKEYLSYIEKTTQALKILKEDLENNKKALQEVKKYLNEMADYFASLKVQPDGEESQGNPEDIICAGVDEKYTSYDTCRDNCKLKTCLFKTSVGGVKCYECPSGGHEQCVDYSMLPADVSWCHPGGICYDLAEFVCSPPVSIMTKELIPIQCTTCKARPDECGLKVHPRSTLFTKCNATCPGECEYAGSYTEKEWDGTNEDLHCFKCPKPLPPSTCEDLKWGFTEQKDCNNYCQQQHGPDASCALQNFQMKAIDEMKERERKAKRNKQGGKPGDKAGQGGDKAAGDKGAKDGAKGNAKGNAGQSANDSTGEKEGGGVNGTPPPPTGGGTGTGSGGSGPSAIAGGGQPPAGGKKFGTGKKSGDQTRVDKKDSPTKPEKPKLPTDTGTTQAPDAPAGSGTKAPEVDTESAATETAKGPCTGKDYKSMFKHAEDDTIEKMNFRSRFIAEYNKGPNNFLDFKESMLNDSKTPTQERVWFNEFNQKIVEAASDPCSGFTYPRRLTKEQESAIKNDPCKDKKRTSVADYTSGETKEQKAFRDRYVQALRSGKLSEFRNSVVDGQGNDEQIEWLSTLDRQVDELVKDPCSDVTRTAPPSVASEKDDKTETSGGTTSREKDPCADKRPFMRSPKDESTGKARMRHNYLRYLRQGQGDFSNFTSSIFNGDNEQKVTWLNELNQEFKTFSEDPCFGGTPPKNVSQPQQPDSTGTDTNRGSVTTSTGAPVEPSKSRITDGGTTALDGDGSASTTQTRGPCAGKRGFDEPADGEDPRKTELRKKLYNAASNYKTLKERSSNLQKFRSEFFKPNGETPQSDIDFMHELFEEFQAMQVDPCFNKDLATRERQRQIEEQARAERPDPCKDKNVKDLSTPAEGERSGKTKIRNGYTDALKNGPEAVEAYKQSLLDSGNPFHTNWFHEIRSEYHRLLNTPCYKDGRDLGRPGFEESTEVKEEEKKPAPTQYEELTEGLGESIKTETKTVGDTTHVTTTYKDGSTLLTTTTGDGTKYYVRKDKDGKGIGSVTEFTDGTSTKIDILYDGDRIKTEKDGRGTTKVTWSDNSTQETLVREDGSQRMITIDKYGYRFTSEYGADGMPVSSSEDSVYKKDPGQRHYELYVYKPNGESWVSLSPELKEIYADSERREQEREADRARWKKFYEDQESRKRKEEEDFQRFTTVNKWLGDMVYESIQLEQAEADRLRTLAQLKVDVESEYNKTIRRLVKLRDEAYARKDMETYHRLDAEVMDTAIWYDPFLKLTDSQKRLDEKQAARWAIGSQANSFARTVQSWAVGDLKRLRETEKDVTKVTQWLLTGSQVQQKTLRERFMSNSEEAYLSARVDWLEGKLKDPNLTSVEREVIYEMLELNEIGLASAREHIRSMHVLIGVGYAVDVGMTIFGGKIIGAAVKGTTAVVGKVASQATMKTLQTPVRTLANRALQRATQPGSRVFANTTGNVLLKAAQKSFDPRYGMGSRAVRAAHWIGTSRGGQLATTLFKAVFTAPIRPSLLWKPANVVFASSSKLGQLAIQKAALEAAEAGGTLSTRAAEKAAQKAVQETVDAGRALASESKAVRLAEQARRSSIRAAAKLAESNLTQAAGVPSTVLGAKTLDNVASSAASMPGGGGPKPKFDPSKTQAFDTVLQPPKKPTLDPTNPAAFDNSVFDPNKTQIFDTVMPARSPVKNPQPSGDYSFDLTTPEGRAAHETFAKAFHDHVADMRLFTGGAKSDEPFDILRNSLEAQPWYRNLPSKGQGPKVIDPNAETIIDGVRKPLTTGTWVDGTRHFPDVLKPPHMPPPGWDKAATIIDQPIPPTGGYREIPSTGFFDNPTVLNRNPFTSTGQFDQVLPIPETIPPTVGPTRFDPTKTQQFDAVLTPPGVTKRFPKVLEPPQVRTPTQKLPATEPLKPSVVAEPPKPKFHNPFKKPAKPLNPGSMKTEAELVAAENAWKAMSIKQKIKLLKDTLRALRDAALQGDKWATRILNEVALGSVKFHFDPRIKGWGLAHTQEGIIRLNPFGPSGHLRSGDSVASTFVHEYVHVFKGGKVWAAENVAGKANLPTKGNYNENRAHLSEVIFNRNLFNARVQQLRDAGKPLTLRNVQKVMDLSKTEELLGALDATIDVKGMEWVLKHGGGLKEYNALLRTGYDWMAIEKAAKAEGLTIKQMLARVRTREGIQLKRTLQRNLVGDYFKYGEKYQDDIVAAIASLSTARGGSIARLNHLIMTRWAKVLKNPNPRSLAEFKLWLQDEFLTVGGAVRKDMRNWDLPDWMKQSYLNAEANYIMKTPMDQLGFSLTPALRSRLNFSQSAVDVAIAQALARGVPLTADDVVSISHGVLQKTLAGSKQKLTMEQYQEAVAEISANSILNFGLQADQAKEAIENEMDKRK